MKKAFIGIVVFLAMTALLMSLAGRSVTAQGQDADGAVLKKLNSIIKTQNDIVAGIADIKEQLTIIKIRVTQSQ